MAEKILFRWARRAAPGEPHLEVSSVGDKRFSALFALMPDGRTIEQWYQCDIKAHDPGGTDWKKGKGQPSRIGYPDDQQYELYLALWRFYLIRNWRLLLELAELAKDKGYLLTDCFANTPINQARALAQILNEWA